MSEESVATSSVDRSADVDELLRRARGAAVAGVDADILRDLDLALADATDAPTRAQLHLASATATQGSADRSLSAVAAERAVALLRRGGDRAAHAVAAAIASTFVARSGRREEALALVVEALAVAEPGEFAGIEGARHANAIATTLYEMGAFVEGEHYARVAVAEMRDATSEAREIVTITLAWTMLEHANAGGPPPDHGDLAAALAVFDEPDATPVGRGLIAPVIRSEIDLLRDEAPADEPTWTASAWRDGLPPRLRGWVELVVADLAFRRGDAESCLDLLDAASDLLEVAVDEHRLMRSRLLRLRSLAALGRTDEVVDLADRLVVASRRHTVAARGDLAVELSSRVAAERTARQLRDTSGALAEALALDPLTGVGSRHRYEEIRAQSAGRSDDCAIFLIDLDGLKSVNDRHGHAVGDRVLAAVGSLLQRCFGSTNEILRLGGDEFVVVLDIADPRVLAALEQHLMSAFREQPWEALGSSVMVTASVGVAVGPRSEFERLVGSADAAMYRAKRDGGDGLVSV